MNAVILHCPPLGRDIGPLLAAVPDATVLTGGIEPSGCLKGHQAAVRMAADRGWSSVWVIEDDCRFLPAFSRARWEADAAWAWAHGYGVLTGGCVATVRPRPVRDGLVAVDRFHSAHCIAYHASAYEIAARMEDPLDVQLGDLGARPVVTVPFMATQLPGYSGNEHRQVDYRAMFDRHEAYLRRVLRTRAVRRPA